MNPALGYLDFGIILFYLAATLLHGVHLANKNQDEEDYFLAGRRLTWPLVGFSLFASNMSGSSFIGLAGEGYARGIAVYNYEWVAAVILIFFVFFVLPLFLQARIFTIPEFLEHRFDYRSRLVFSGFTILANMFVDAAAGLYAGGVVVHLLYPEVPIWIPIAVLGFIAGLYTIFGGLSAVVVTDTVQAIVLMFGSLLVAILSFSKLDSWQQIYSIAPAGGMHLIRPIDDAFIPWPGLFSGVLIIGFYFWATNQFIVQRTLGAKNLTHGRLGALFAGFLKLPVLFLMVLPGTIALSLYPNLESPDLVFPTLVFDLLPLGARGLVIAAMIAAIISSIDSTLNSASTLVTMDFIKRYKPNLSRKELVVAGRWVTALFMCFAVAWAPQILRFDTLWQYLQSVLAYITPPVVVCFLAGIFWQGTTARAAFLTLLLGIPLGVLGFVLNELLAFSEIHFLYACALLFLCSFALIVAVSYFSPPPSTLQVQNYCWHWRLLQEESMELATLPWYQNYRILSLALFVCVGVLLFYFW